MVKEDILKTLKEHQNYIQNKFSVDKIGVFGSYIDDTQKSDSDIDFYVEFRNKNFNNLAGLWVYLEKLFNKKVDIIYEHKNSNKVILNKIKEKVIYG